MRVDTLYDPATAKYLNENFILATHNQLPQLYCSGKTVDATAAAPYPAAQMKRVHEGAGGGNVRSYFCTPEGRVVNMVAGRWKRARYLEEARWSAAHLTDPKTQLAAAHAERASKLEKERDGAAPPMVLGRVYSKLSKTGGTSDAAALRLLRVATSYNRLIRSHRECGALITRDVRDVLKQVEEEVYTKGAVGCDF